MWSADVALGEEEKAGSFSGALGWVSGLLGLALGVGLFMVLPSLLVGLLPVALSPLADSLLEGLVRLLLVVGYIWGSGFCPTFAGFSPTTGRSTKPSTPTRPVCR